MSLFYAVPDFCLGSVHTLLSFNPCSQCWQKNSTTSLSILLQDLTIGDVKVTSCF